MECSQNFSQICAGNIGDFQEIINANILSKVTKDSIGIQASRQVTKFSVTWAGDIVFEP